MINDRYTHTHTDTSKQKNNFKWANNNKLCTSLLRGFPLNDNRLPQSLRWLSDENDLHIGCGADIVCSLSEKITINARKQINKKAEN